MEEVFRAGTSEGSGSESHHTKDRVTRLLGIREDHWAHDVCTTYPSKGRYLKSLVCTCLKVSATRFQRLHLDSKQPKPLVMTYCYRIQTRSAESTFFSRRRFHRYQ